MLEFPLRPGQQPTPADFNRLAAKVGPPGAASVGSLLQRDAGGSSSVASKTIQPIWARITGNSADEDNPHHHEWKAVYLDLDGRWQFVEDNADFAVTYESQLYGETILNPAIEINGHIVPIGTIIQLVPDRVVVDQYDHTYRHWLFSSERLRPFRLIDSIVGGVAAAVSGTYPGDGNEQIRAWTEADPEALEAPDNSAPGAGVREGMGRVAWAKAEWLDDPGTEFILYPMHEHGFEAGDHWFNIGVARGRTDYNMGARGWATYVPEGTQTGWDDDDNPIWRGQWQLVTIEEEPTILAIQDYGATIQPNEMGSMRCVRTMKTGPGGVAESKLDGDEADFSASVFNNLPVPLTTGSYHRLAFNKQNFIWEPMTPLASSHGRSVYADANTEIPDVNWVVIPFNQTIESFGEVVDRVGNTIANTGSVDIIGIVSWTVTGHRRITDVVGGAAGPVDIDSRLQAALFNNGVMVTGSQSEMTSSRRNAVGEGANAVNSLSGSIIQTLAAGDALEIKVRCLNQADADDYWRTLADMCHLTFNSLVSVYQ
jgi:hypothetical protein